MRSVSFAKKPPRLNLESCSSDRDEESNSSSTQYLPRTPYPRQRFFSPLPSPRSIATATTTTSTNGHTTAAQRQLPFETYPGDEVKEEISRFFHENLAYLNKPAHDNKNENDKEHPAAGASNAKRSNNNNVTGGTAAAASSNDGDDIALDIEYDIAVLAFDDELKLHKVHPVVFREYYYDDDDVSNSNRPDHVLARQIRIYAPFPFPQPLISSSSSSSFPSSEWEKAVSRLYREVLSKHDMLDTAVEICYYLSENGKAEHEHEQGGNGMRQRLLWFPPEQFWYRGTGKGTGTGMKMDRDGLSACVGSLLYASYRRNEEGKEEEVSRRLPKCDGGLEGEREREGVVKGEVQVEVEVEVHVWPPAETLDDIVEE
jgi:hypothetical protein